MKKKLLFLICGCLSVSLVCAQTNIDFTGFDGSGFAPTPAAGQLSSNIFSIKGISTGNVNFGDTDTSGDAARGSSPGGTTSGGIYAFDVGSGNIALGGQPTGSDLTSGEIYVQLQNQTGSPVTSVDISYKIYVFNDQSRGNALNFAYDVSSDVNSCTISDFTDVAALDFVSPEAADGTPAWTQTNRSTTLDLTADPIGIDEYLVLAFKFDDSSGSGSRDEFAIDDIIVTSLVPLPVEFTHFNAKKNDNNEVALEWATATELENDYFQVERSLDGKSFVELAKVQGAGTTVEAQIYNYVDAAPKAGVNYYRLKQVDVDGTYEYSDIVTVTMEEEGEVKAYPVPTAEVLTIESVREISEVQVMDITGKVVKMEQFDDATQVQLNVVNLLAGSYFVAIQTAGTVEMIRFVKQ